MLPEGKLRAWVEQRREDELVAAYIGVPSSSEADPLTRPPATQVFTSLSEAKYWIESEAKALGLPVEWAGERNRVSYGRND